jgi:hypothetical protein
MIKVKFLARNFLSKNFFFATIILICSTFYHKKGSASVLVNNISGCGSGRPKNIPSNPILRNRKTDCADIFVKQKVFEKSSPCGENHWGSNLIYGIGEAVELLHESFVLLLQHLGLSRAANQYL